MGLSPIKTCLEEGGHQPGQEEPGGQEVCLEKTPQECIFPTVFLFADTLPSIQDPPEKVLKDRARIHVGELTRWGTHTGWKPPKGPLNQFLFFSSLP